MAFGKSGNGAAEEDFLARLLASQRGIHALLVSLLPSAHDIDDVFQQVCLALWKDRSKYDPARPFLPWAYAFVRNIVHTHVREKARLGSVVLSPDLIDRIALARESIDATAEARRAALDRCLESLSPAQRELLVKRYASTESLAQTAAAQRTTAAALTMRLQRLRHALLRCVEQSLARGEAS
jgi:RNA polymerase sigma-70 factor (ECF subfamily)